MKSFLLVAILVVISKADDVEDSQILSAAANPYADVGPCTQNILNQKLTNFTSLDEIAGTGVYDYVYATGKFLCGSAEIHKSSKSYIGTATRHNKANDKATPVPYTVKLIHHGVIQEIFQVKNDKPYTFNLIVLHWDRKNGVFEYARCSDSGTNKDDSRSIVVKAPKTNNVGMQIAKELYDNDYKLKLKGSLNTMSICNT